VKILAVHAFGSQSAKGSSMNVLKGLDWAGSSKSDVVNMSFAGAADSELQIMLAALRRNGIALIAAAGNAGPNARPLYPAAYPEVIAVTATDADDKVFDQANRGTHIAVAAPGVAILAAAPNDSYQIQSGTSFRGRAGERGRGAADRTQSQSRRRIDPPHPDIDGARSRRARTR
jgi:subtilisin family serine protease